MIDDRTNATDIEYAVMRRIRAARALRLLLSGFAASCVLFAAALWGIGREVWIARVFENAPENAADLPRFYLSAFDHARLVVQALAILVAGSFLYLARKVSRSLVQIFSPVGV